MKNIEQVEKAYYETLDKLNNHWIKYEAEGITEEEIDALDEVADDWHETLEKIIKEVRVAVAPMLKSQDKTVTDEGVRNLFIFKQETAMNKAFKLLSL